MRSKVVKLLALTLVVSGAGMVMGQQSSPSERKPKLNEPKLVRVEEDETPSPKQQKATQKRSNLEEMLAEALKNNPDIRVAVAKLAEAEAELNRTRVQVTQQVAMLHHAILSQKATVDHEQKRYERMKTLSKQGSIDLTLLDEGLLKLTAAKAKLAELEAQVPGLLGKSPQSEYTLTIQEAKLLRQEAIRSSIQTRTTLIEEAEGKMAPKVAGPMAEKIRKALSRTISVTFKDQPIAVIADYLSSDSGLLIKLREEPGVPVREKLTVRGENLPFGAVLQLLEDSLPFYTIVVRDYGLLITHQQRIPPGAISVQEFLRQKPTVK